MRYESYSSIHVCAGVHVTLSFKSASLHGLAVGSLWYRSQPSADEERRSAFLLHLSPTYYGIKTGAS